MNYAKQALRGSYWFERLTPQRNENDPGVCVTEESLSQFLDSCHRRGVSELTMRCYGKYIRALYEYLPKDKVIHYGTLEEWRSALVESGYVNSTVNSYLSVANVYLDFIGRREYQLPDRLKTTMEEQPELSREEYLRMLDAARRCGKERDYLLIKLFATVEMNVRELPRLTVEAIKSGKVATEWNRVKRVIYFPEILQKELLAFAKRKGIESGPIFLTTREGRPMNRAYVTRIIRAICPTADVAENKGSTRCLQKLYQSTRASLESNISLLVDQAHERLLEKEQLEIGWEEIQ